MFLIGFLITIGKPEILSCIYVEGLEMISKLKFVFPSPVTMVKSHKKNYQNYFCVTMNNMVKCCCCQQEKHDGFWLPWGIFKRRVYQTKHYYGIFKKSAFPFSSDLQTDKKVNNVKQDPRRKLWFFPSAALPKCLWGFNKKK